jgi:hypothetical protein
MAKSHHDVGVAFGNLATNATGSRMSTLRIQNQNPDNDAHRAGQGLSFYLLQSGISYRTVVARIMRNVHTKRNELWITPRRYSQSTEKHKGYFLNGYRKSHGINERWWDDVYYTPCVDQNLDRHNPDHVYNTLGRINADLPDVDKPRLREATRRGTIASCLLKAEVTMRNFTHNIPLDAVDAPALYELQTMIGFLNSLSTNPDIDAVRAAVRGHLALMEVTR